MLTRLERTRTPNIPLDLQLHVFDYIILPIALYACEVWGLENTQHIENLHNEFLIRITNLNKKVYLFTCYMPN